MLDETDETISFFHIFYIGRILIEGGLGPQLSLWLRLCLVVPGLSSYIIA